MNELQVFDYNNKIVRTIERDGVLWWVLKDVCKILKLTNTTSIAKRLEDDEVAKLDLGGKVGMTNIINESGLYNVILRSDKPEAKPFRKWVTSEVLPSIRKTGSYSVNKSVDQGAMANMFRDFLQIQQQQFSLLMQNQLAQQQAQQESNKQQLTEIANLITSALPQPYKPPFTRWMEKAFKKVDIIAIQPVLSADRCYISSTQSYKIPMT